MIIYLTDRSYAIEVSVVLKINILFDIGIERGFVKILRFVRLNNSVVQFNNYIYYLLYISYMSTDILFFKAIANLCNLIYIATNL